jgi:hypothetical protein
LSANSGVSLVRLGVLACTLGLQVGCKACFGPPASPKENKSDGGGDDSGGDDTATDTAEDAACAVPEQEPNNSTEKPQDLPMDRWACGTFDSTIDPDIFGFQTNTEDWLKLEVVAAEAGSSADVQMLVTGGDDEYTAVSQFGFMTTDPSVVFPAPAETDFTVILNEMYYGYGESYHWKMMGTVTKAPVEWDDEEIESNDLQADGTPIESGDSLWGTVASSSDLDWFSLEIPEGKVEVDVDVDAWMYGSPADVKISAYDPDGTWFAKSLYGDTVYDQDPHLEFTPDQSGTWGLLIREEHSKGSPMYWYVVRVTVTESESVDTSGAGETADTAGR